MFVRAGSCDFFVDRSSVLSVCESRLGHWNSPGRSPVQLITHTTFATNFRQELTMRSAKSMGRIIGALLVLQLAGLMVPFILLHPLLAPPSFLENAAAVSFQIKVAVFLLFANCALTIGISIGAFQIFRQYSYPMALWLVAVSIIMFLAQAVDNIHLLSMVSLSQEYAKTGVSHPELFQPVAIAMGATRKWSHYTELLVIDGWMFMFYGLLWRSAIVPRTLAVFGLLTVALHITGITLPLWLSYHSVTLMGVPLAFSHIALALWLLVKGFDSQSAIVQMAQPA
jgi:hypothetical protein